MREIFGSEAALSHYSHASDDIMIRQCKSRLRVDLHALYQECQQCLKNKASKSKPWIEVHPGDLFKHFFPGENLSCDFGIYNGSEILVVCDLLTGLVQGYHCCNQSTEEAVTKLRHFFAQYGLCLLIEQILS